MNIKTNSTSTFFRHFLFLVILLLPLTSVPALAATGQVNVNTIYQQLEGFGGSGAWYEGWLTAHPQKNEIYNVLFGELGIDIYRIRNTYQIDSDYMFRSSQIVTAAKARNPMIKIMISSWSPPGGLKSNGEPTGYNSTLKKDGGGYMYEEFAEWWANSLNAWSSPTYEVDADYINMQNEPDFSPSPPYEWDSCRFDPTENSTFAGYNLAFEALYAELSGMANFPKLLAPEACGMNSSANYIEALINKSHVYGYAHHLYAGDDGGSGSNPDGYLTTMTNFAAAYGNKPLLQTEYAHNMDTFTDAMNLARLMHNSLTVEGVSAYMYWDLFWGDSGGLVTLIDPWGPNYEYIINPVYYAFKHYAAFTDPNWYRVGSSTNSSYLRISAFKNPDDTKLSIVIINDASGNISLSLSLGVFSPTSSEVYRTSDTENTAYVGTFNESVPIVLPGESITTISLVGSSSLYSNCSEVKAAGYRLTSDIGGDGDCYVNYVDLDVIIDHWLSIDCAAHSDCDGADFESDGDVDFVDFSTFALQWMWCNDPEDSGCIQY